MNFKEWYKKHREYNYDTVYAPHESEIAWDACKNEILNILENNKREICSHGYDAGMEYVYLDDVKGMIEKL